MSRHDEGYDWLDDPFDEKKAQAERERAQSGNGARMAGCALAVVACIVFIAAVCIIGASALGSLA